MMISFISPENRKVLSPGKEAEMQGFCKGCPQCGGLVDEFPDCLGDGDPSPDGHMPACELCIAYYLEAV